MKNFDGAALLMTDLPPAIFTKLYCIIFFLLFKADM